MPYNVTISFSRDRQYEFKFLDNDTALLTPAEAQEWLDHEWEDLDCVPTNPVGKVLRLDKVLLVAQYAGEKRFAEAGAWAQRYARAVVSALSRDNVLVDVAEHLVT
ncbi:MAG: hypothetical protein D4S02_17460 [Rhodocyclaceae bacterium]|nr:MAG: hypothetical protein D4S02_17460 [Rhodocyclaceae bacterium]